MATIQASTYQILVDESWEVFSSFVTQKKYSKVFILIDENTKVHCYDKVAKEFSFAHELIEIQSGEEEKNLSTCEIVWNALLEKSCDRKSLLINLGGGVIGDLGGFCASTYMRGIDFIQVPTTLLSQVDASVGGKLGVDHHSIKNIIGVFKNPQMVWAHTGFLSSLPANELRSGYAEVIKHCLIADKQQWKEIKTYSSLSEVKDWTKLVYDSIQIKNRVVKDDPFEAGKRKILNFGHTIGHAIESSLLHTTDKLLHGEAIAQGMILESKLSMAHGKLAEEAMVEVQGYIEKIYGKLDTDQLNLDELISIAKKDKKNLAGAIRVATIDDIGSCVFDLVVSEKEIIDLF